MTNADDEVAEELRQAVGRFVRAMRARSATMPVAQAAVLGDLDRRGPLTVTELARRRSVRHQSMRAIVGGLEQSNYVARAPDPSDGRTKTVTMTPAGRAALATERSTRSASIAVAIATGLSASERRLLPELVRVLTKLSAG